MTALARARKWIFGSGQSTEGPAAQGPVRKGTFSPEADTARAQYFKHKESEATGDGPGETELSLLQRRMHSGKV